MAFERFIHEFLNELLVNDDLSTQYDEDPDAAMDAFGLNPAQRELLLNGTNDDIRKELKQEMKTHIAYVIRMG
jgi:hypothetical protein